MVWQSSILWLYPFWLISTCTWAPCCGWCCYLHHRRRLPTRRKCRHSPKDFSRSAFCDRSNFWPFWLWPLPRDTTSLCWQYSHPKFYTKSTPVWCLPFFQPLSTCSQNVLQTTLKYIQNEKENYALLYQNTYTHKKYRLDKRVHRTYLRRIESMLRSSIVRLLLFLWVSIWTWSLLILFLIHKRCLFARRSMQKLLNSTRRDWSHSWIVAWQRE